MTVVKRGDKFRIRKGTVIRSTNPSAKTKTAGRDYVVSAFDTNREWKVTPMFMLSHPDLMEQAGVTEKELAELRELNDKAFFQEPKYVLRKGELCWVGTGGYWCYADMDQVERV